MTSFVIGRLELRSLSERRASQVGTPLIGTVHVDPVTGDTVRRISRLWSGDEHAYPPAVPYACPWCIGYPCECGSAGAGC
jgi:hypothetical protein